MGSSTLKTVGLFLLLVLVISLTTFGLLKQIPSVGGSLSKSDVQDIVRELIHDNPEIIIESLTKHQQRAEMAQEQSSKQAILDNKEWLENDPTSPFIGNPDGDVVVVEFFDYSCPYCTKVHPYLIKLINEDKNVKVVFKEFPILGQNSLIASKAAIAVHMVNPEKYEEIHERLMTKRTSGKEAVLKVVSDMGLDAGIISAKMDSEEVNAVINKNKDLAARVGVRGTPAFTINGEFIPGAIDYEQLKQKVESARQENAKSN